MDWDEFEDLDHLDDFDEMEGFDEFEGELDEKTLNKLKELRKMMSGEEPFMMVRHKGLVIPQPLKKGDKIAIIAPASAVKEEYVLGAAAVIAERGYEPVIMPHAIGHTTGSYSADKGDRLVDLIDALEDSKIRAILCARGGYGCVQLLPNLSYNTIASKPKWLIGYSDVSALLAAWYVSDIASIHGPMAKHLTLEDPDDPCTNALFNILETGGHFDYIFPSSPMNEPGQATGTLLGGNMAVLSGLAGTPYDILNLDKTEDDVILFFEDISEPIYCIERMLWRLVLTGTLTMVKGLIFGRFTEYKPDKNFQTVEEMINFWRMRMLIPPIPIVYDFPIGHVKENFPLIEGARVELEVTETVVSLKTIN